MCHNVWGKQWRLFVFLDKWLGYDVVILGARALGISFQSCHLRACLLTLDFFQCWRVDV